MEILIAFVLGASLGTFVMAMFNTASYHKGYNDGRIEAMYAQRLRSVTTEQRPALRDKDV